MPSKSVIKFLIQSPPSSIAWKKYQLYRATHERMWAMSTTSLSPNMGYVPLCLSLQFILVVFLGGKNCTGWFHMHWNKRHTLSIKHILSNPINSMLYQQTRELFIITSDRFGQHAGTKGPNPHQFPTFAQYAFWYCWTCDFEVLVTASWL